MAVTECSLAELMEDPLVGLVMQSDAVDRCEVELLFERVARRRASADGIFDSPAWLPVMETPPC